MIAFSGNVHQSLQIASYERSVSLLDRLWTLLLNACTRQSNFIPIVRTAREY